MRWYAALRADVISLVTTGKQYGVIEFLIGKPTFYNKPQKFE